MSELHLELPESLHRQLRERAKQEGVALHDYIVDSLTRFAAVPDPAGQKAAFEELLSRYPAEQAEAALKDLLASRE